MVSQNANSFMNTMFGWAIVPSVDLPGRRRGDQVGAKRVPVPSREGGETPRNLMGCKDGAQTPQQVEKVVWVNQGGPAWMRGGSYVVVRRVRMALEHWDRTNVGFQEQTVGRHKLSGAPLGLKGEFEPLGLDRIDKDENPIIPENALVRPANAASNGGAGAPAPGVFVQ